jgi:hypothetical protein
MSGNVHLIQAGLLSGEHIGKLIRFRTWDEGGEIAEVVTAELRQVYHISGQTTLTYGIGAQREVNLPETQAVVLYPRSDYADVVALTDQNERAAREAEKLSL